MNYLTDYDEASIHPIFTKDGLQYRSFHLPMQEGFYESEDGEFEMVTVCLN